LTTYKTVIKVETFVALKAN